MQKTSLYIEQNPKWKILESYILRIKSYSNTDPGLVVENCKSLIESIFKTILVEIKHKTNSELKKFDFISLNDHTCKVLGLENKGYIDLLKSFSKTIAEFRNKLGETSHGKDIYTLQDNRDLLVDDETSFLIGLTDSISDFLLNYYSNLFSDKRKVAKISYEENEKFNNWFDESEDLIIIKGLEFSASKILFDNDIEAYKMYLIDYNQVESKL